jgi:translation initiation factor IF-2
MSCQELAESLAVNDSEIVKVLFMKGIGITVNQTLDEETVKLVCKDFDVEVVEAGSIRVEDLAKKSNVFLDDEDADHLVPRPPVVTIMGHVDHGKTSLLDFIRKTKVAAGEAGGITQGIGAYSIDVKVEDEVQSCVFLDTPGHEAFSAMRARGARVTDIAVIVVAADDGVRPQTLEAIAHAKAADVPIVIAINKIDKDGANPQVVMQELSTHGLMPEEWGGDIPMVQVSAKKGTNIDTLLENIILVAEFQELKANPDREAKGTVIEASLDKARGPLATLLVQNGTLRVGDVVLCGEAYGKVRALMDYTGERVDEAGPSTAVQILGLSQVPVAGDEFEVVESLESARSRASDYAEIARNSRLQAQAGEGKVTLHSFANAVAASAETGVERHQLNVVLKVDAQGSVEAIREVVQALPQDTVALRFLMQSTGEISGSDVDLALASGAIVVGFNVGVQASVQAQADAEGVEIRMYRVIYDLVDDIRKAMEGLLEDVEEEVPIGEAEVRAVFGAGSGKVAGCMVTEGKLVKGAGIRVLRGKESVHVGTITSLRRVKELAKEVAAGLECGVGTQDFNEWQEGDKIMAFNLVAKKRTLEDASVTVNAAVNSLTLHNEVRA